MGLYEDARKIFLDLFGFEVADQLKNFEDPNKYPKEFLEECTYFLSKLMGEELAKEKMKPLYKKYLKRKR